MTKSFKTFYLHFNSPLHIGNHRDTYEQSERFIRSDTLIAAVYATWAKMGKADWIPSDGIPPFTISSAFPFWKNEGKIHHFFPRLKVTTKPKSEQSYNTILAKALKKIQWLDQAYFEQLLAGTTSANFGENGRDLQGNFLTSTQLPEAGFMVKEEMQRVAIPRYQDGVPEDAKPFYMERIRFINSGLFFLATGKDLDKLEKALSLLQYEGLGTDRNVGNGFFELKQAELHLQIPDDSPYSTNLSLYCPVSEQVLQQQLDDHSRFEVIKRGGWITTPNYQTLEKNSIYMFSEGSVFLENKEIVGRGGIDLTPYHPMNHPVFRCGQSIFLPVKLDV